MNETDIEKLTTEITKDLPWVDAAVRGTLEAANAKGLLNPGAVKVRGGEIRRGDWIAFFRDGQPDEIYLAVGDMDTNLDGSLPGGEFYRLPRSVFGKPEVRVDVEDLEPGTRLRAGFKYSKGTEWVVLKDEAVLDVGGDSGEWSLANDDFTVEEVYN